MAEQKQIEKVSEKVGGWTVPDLGTVKTSDFASGRLVRWIGEKKDVQVQARGIGPEELQELWKRLPELYSRAINEQYVAKGLRVDFDCNRIFIKRSKRYSAIVEFLEYKKGVSPAWRGIKVYMKNNQWYGSSVVSKG